MVADGWLLPLLLGLLLLWPSPLSSSRSHQGELTNQIRALGKQTLAERPVSQPVVAQSYLTAHFRPAPSVVRSDALWTGERQIRADERERERDEARLASPVRESRALVATFQSFSSLATFAAVPVS